MHRGIHWGTLFVGFIFTAVVLGVLGMIPGASKVRTWITGA